MTEHMTCDQFSDLLSAYLERDVDDTTRAEMEAHAARCRECGALLADLREVQTRAGNLPELTPSRDLWSGIAARIETPVIDLSSGQHPAVKRRWTQRRWVRPGVAAAALVLITAGVTHVMTRRAYAPAASTASGNDSMMVARVPAETAAAPDASPKNPNTNEAARARFAANKARSAEQTYDQEIGRLRAIVEQRRTQLDTTTLKVIEHNLVVIDSAITQCKAALRRDPASRFLTESLNDALDTKIELLRTAAMLPPRIS